MKPIAALVSAVRAFVCEYLHCHTVRTNPKGTVAVVHCPTCRKDVRTFHV